MTDERISARAPGRTRLQRAEMVERFRQSGLSRAAFAQEHGVRVRTMSRWLTEAKRAATAAPPMVFSELKLGPVVAPVSVPWAMEVVSVNGLTIRCREALPVRELGRLLRV